MSKLSELKPEQKERVCDLLERAGIKVPTNKNRFFMSLPAFNQSNIVVINFWYGEQIKQQGENIIVKWPLPTTKKEPSARMQRVHDAIKSAIEKILKSALSSSMGNRHQREARFSNALLTQLLGLLLPTI